MSVERESTTRGALVSWYPVDLAVVSVAAAGCYVLTATVPTGGVANFVVALPYLFFLPGYALVSVLFPGSPRPGTPGPNGSGRPTGIDGLERLALSFALSIVFVAVLALSLAPSQWGLEITPISFAVGAGTIVFAQIGVIRRVRLPRDERFVAKPLTIVGRFRGESGGFTSTVSSGLLVVAIVTATLVLTVALAAPLSGGTYSELRLTTEGVGGEPIAGGFPDSIAPGETIPAVIDVENQEGDRTTYTVIVQEQQLEDGAVVDRVELERAELSVDDATTESLEFDVAPVATDGTIRVSVLLYDTSDGDPPSEPSNDTADQDAFFWTTVTDDSDD